MTIPQGDGRGNSSGVIRGYSDVLARSQRLRPDGSPVWPLRVGDFGRPDARRLRPLVRRETETAPVAGEPWWHSLLLWCAIIAVVALVYRVLP